MVAVALSTLVNKALAWVKDQSGKAATDADSYVREAIRVVSRDWPKLVAYDFAGNGGREYDLPPSFDAEVSEIKAVFVPYDDDEALSPEEYWLDLTPTGWKLKFDSAISTNVTARIRYTVPYTITGTAGSETVDMTERVADACAVLAASMLCQMLAEYYSAQSEASYSLEAVEFRTKAGEYSARAKELATTYRRRLPAAKGSVSDWDLRSAFGGPLLVRGGRYAR